MKSNGKGHKEEVNAFLNAVNDGKDSPINFRSVCLTTLTTFKIIDSLKTGLPQEINIAMYNLALKSLDKLEKYCNSEKFQGWDPFDGLNSRSFQAIPIISKNRFVRLAWIQAFKRSPLNFRYITGM